MGWARFLGPGSENPNNLGFSIRTGPVLFDSVTRVTDQGPDREKLNDFKELHVSFYF